MSKLKRIIVKIKRGVTDDTPVIVWPWEKPLIEEIHGGNSVEINVDDMVKLTGAKSVKTIKMQEREDKDGKTVQAIAAPSPRDSILKMLDVDPENDPLDDPAQEWARMVQFYGMHPAIQISVVEKVYSNERLFRQCMRDFAAGRVPEFLADMDEAIEDEDNIPIAEMTITQLRDKAKALGIQFPPKTGRDRLEELILAKQDAPEQAAA